MASGDEDIEQGPEGIELQRLRTQLSVNDQTRDHWVAIFNKFDENHDGRISFRELKHKLKEIDHDIPTNTVRAIWRKGDVDENGYLSLNEFLGIVKENKELRGLFGKALGRWVTTVCVIPKKPCVTPTPAIAARVAPSTDVPDAEAEYEEQYSCCPPPCFMIIISLLEIISFIYDAVVRAPNQPLSHTVLAYLFIYDPHRRVEAWRYLSYMFVHIGVFHLIVNLVVQIMLGIPLEMVHRWWRVMLIYVAGVVAGSLATSVSDPSVYLAGASGGVYALIAAHVATIIMNWSEMKFAIIQLGIFLVLATVDIGTAIYNRYILEDPNDQVGYVAHLAGAIAGLLVGINVLRNLEVKKWENKLWWVAIIVYTLLMLAAIIWNAAFPSYFPQQYV